MNQTRAKMKSKIRAVKFLGKFISDCTFNSQKIIVLGKDKLKELANAPMEEKPAEGGDKKKKGDGKKRKKKGDGGSNNNDSKTKRKSVKEGDAGEKKSKKKKRVKTIA